MSKKPTHIKVVVWKDGTFILTEGPTWEYENDPKWLVTVIVSEVTGPTFKCEGCPSTDICGSYEECSYKDIMHEIL